MQVQAKGGNQQRKCDHVMDKLFQEVPALRFDGLCRQQVDIEADFNQVIPSDVLRHVLERKQQGRRD